MDDTQHEGRRAFFDHDRLRARRTFLISSLAAAIAFAARPVLAQKSDTRGLTAGMIDMQTRDGSIPAYRAMPVKGSGFPVILVVQEIYGVQEYIKDVCRRFAKQGYLAIAPEMYFRQGDVEQLKTDQDILEKVVKHVPDAQALDDLDSAVSWAGRNKGNTSKLGITGFSWGGRLAWLYAARNASVKAAVAWHGWLSGEKNEVTPRQPLDVADAIHAPVLGLYGGAPDPSIPADAVDRMRRALKDAGKEAEIVVYPDAPGAFYADYRPTTFRSDRAEDGWKRTLAWFRGHGV